MKRELRGAFMIQSFSHFSTKSALPRRNSHSSKLCQLDSMILWLEMESISNNAAANVSKDPASMIRNGIRVKVIVSKSISIFHLGKLTALSAAIISSMTKPSFRGGLTILLSSYC